jgi:hypothetical protein
MKTKHLLILLYSLLSVVLCFNSLYVLRLGNSVPTASDDVIINALGGASVQISQPAAANSVTIAGGYELWFLFSLFCSLNIFRQYPQTLILLSSLAVGNGGITVARGGTLQVCSSPFQYSLNNVGRCKATTICPWQRQAQLQSLQDPR